MTDIYRMNHSHFVGGTFTAFPANDSQGLGPQGQEQPGKQPSRAPFDGDNISATASEMINEAFCKACSRDKNLPTSGLGPQGQEQPAGKQPSGAAFDGDNISTTASEMINEAFCKACGRGKTIPKPTDNISATASEMISEAFCKACGRDKDFSKPTDDISATASEMISKAICNACLHCGPDIIAGKVREQRKKPII